MSKNKEDSGNVVNDGIEETHVQETYIRRARKDANYVASFDGSGIIITTV